MRVLLADDHDLVLETIASFLKSEGGFDVETCGSLEDACQKIGNDIAYDLVLLDYTMPGMNGLEGMKKAIEVSFGRPVALMSGT
ncbi:MAG: response regulator, partial [Pseudomonadota bacterium]